MVQRIVKYKLRKNDTVKVISGKERGKTGRVLRIDQEKGRAVVEGINMVKKAIRPSSQNKKGGITSIEAAVHTANLMIVCKKCGPVRIGRKIEGGQKIRFCRKCGEQL